MVITTVGIFLFLWTLTTHGKPSNSGDEPHYLLVCESLIRDGDLDLQNNYATGDAAIFGRGDLLPENHARLSPSGSLMPVHDIGLPVLLTPIYGVATWLGNRMPQDVLARFRQNRGLFAYSLIGLTLIMLTTASSLAFAGLLTTWMTPRLAAVATAAVFLSPPILGTAFVVFPEVPALFISTLVLFLAYRKGSTLRFSEAATAALLIGLLPWVHRKYLPLAIGLALVIVLIHAKTLATFDRSKRSVLAALSLGPVVALLLITYVMWGNVVGPLAAERIPLSLKTLQTGFFGLLADRESGLLAWAPVWFAWPAAVSLERRDARWSWVPVLLVLLPSAAHDQWWGGWSPAVRFLVPVVPWMAFAMALLLPRRRGATLLACLFAPTLLVVGHCWQRPRSMWPAGDGRNAALDALPVIGQDIAAVFPSFRTADVGALQVGFLTLGVAIISALVVSARAADEKRHP